MKKFERVKAVVSLDAIAHNFEEMKKNIADGTRIVAVIKADGYGHGAEAISRPSPVHRNRQSRHPVPNPGADCVPRFPGSMPPP